MEIRRVVTRAMGCGMGAAAAVVALAAPAHAASGIRRLAAPYAGSGRQTEMTCVKPNMVPNCGASASADPRSGVMSAVSSVDSGLNGQLPGSPTSRAEAIIHSGIDMGTATVATFTVHLHVVRAVTSAIGSGYAYPLITASASCARCAPGEEQYVIPAGPETDTLVVSVHRAASAGSKAVLDIVTGARSDIECDDFCFTPSGAARADVQAVVTSVDVTLGH